MPPLGSRTRAERALDEQHGVVDALQAAVRAYERAGRGGAPAARQVAKLLRQEAQRRENARRNLARLRG